MALGNIPIRDMEAICVEANHGFCNMLGYSCDEIIGNPVLENVHPDYENHMTGEVPSDDS